MLHVRVVCPPDRTACLVTALAANSGVQNLVVIKGTARLPDGDAVQFDVQNRSANPVLRELRGLDLDGVTTIPAAASLGLSLAFAYWHTAWGSLLQLLLNVVLLVVGAAGLSGQRIIWRRLSGQPGAKGSLWD